jgi:AcrR family transcriptional regulator
MAKARKKAKTNPKPDAILAAAMAMAERDGWDNLRLRRLADELSIELADLRAEFRDADAIADAWFRRAERAMLAPVGRHFYDMATKERVRVLMLRWFDALSPHRRVTAEMIRAKLWPYHPHHYVPLVFNLSRLIQWLRDAAGLDTGGRRRQLEEIGLTVLFLATLSVWCADASEGQARTRAFLDKRLAEADRLMAHWR